LTGQFVAAPLIGAIVPGSGDPFNGIVDANNPNYSKYFVHKPPIKWGPRVGFAYDPFGNSKTAIRGGAGIMYNLKMGGGGIAALTSPPTRLTPFIYYGNVNTFADAGNTVLFPSSIRTSVRDLDVPTVYQYSLGVQRDIGFSTVIEVAYVGTTTRNLKQFRNINTLPYGTRFLPENLDPTTGRALPDDFLRPFIGWGQIRRDENTGSSNYNSLQLQLNRRFTRGLQFGASYTWSRSYDYGSAVESETPMYAPLEEWAYGVSDFDRPHMASANWTWDVPNASKLWDRAPVRAVLDGWRISGILTMSSGSPVTIGFTTIDNADLVGGGDGVRPNLVGDPTLPASERTLDKFFNPNAFARPAVGEIGNAGRNTVRGPGFQNWDISIMKDFGAQSARMQVRWDLFNAFNHTQWLTMDTTARFDAAGNQTNSRFGAITSTRDPRRMQLSLRVTF
jgi:hypothetical protein